MPEAIKKVPLNVWLLGLLWASIYACSPVALLVLDALSDGKPLPSWHTVCRLSVGCAALGAGGYWRKHIALLQLPPVVEAAKEMAAGGQQ